MSCCSCLAQLGQENPQCHRIIRAGKDLQDAQVQPLLQTILLVQPKAHPLSSSMSTAQKKESSGRKKPVYLDTKPLHPQQNTICCSVTLYLQEERQFGPCQYLTHADNNICIVRSSRCPRTQTPTPRWTPGPAHAQSADIGLEPKPTRVALLLPKCCPAHSLPCQGVADAPN